MLTPLSIREVTFRNRIAVTMGWLWAYVTFGRGARLITGHDN